MKINKYKKYINKFKNVSIYTGGNFIIKAVNTITLPIFTRLLTQSDYGILSACNTIHIFSGNIFRLGVHQSILKQYLEFNDVRERKKYLGSVTSFSLLWSLGLIAFFSIFGPKLIPKIFPGISYFPYILLAFLSPLFGTPIMVFMSTARMENRPWLYAIIAITKSVLGVILGIWFVWRFRLGVIGKLGGPVVISIIIIIILFFQRRLSFAFKFNYWHSAINFGSPLALSWIFDGILSIYIVSLIINLAGLEEAAIFHIGKRIGMLLPGFFINAIEIAYIPFLYRELSNGNIKKIGKINTAYIFFISGFSCLLMLLSRPLILTFATNKYIESIPVMRVFFIWAVFRCFLTLPMVYLYYQNRTKIASIINIFSAVISVPLLWFLFNLYGIVGAALSFLAIIVIKDILYFIISKIPLKYVVFYE